MQILSFVFGAEPKRPRLPHIEKAPPGVAWRSVRAKPGRPVRADLALRNGEIETPRGVLHYAAGKHYIVHYAPGDRAPVRRELFDHLYRRRDEDGLFEKRVDLVFRYFTLPYAVIVDTLEGAVRAAPGSWIMEGAAGELWPIPAAEAAEKYVPA